MKKTIIFMSIALLSLVCVFVACSSDNDEPKPEDKKEIPEGLVSADEFLRIVDGKVWIDDATYESVWVNAKGEEFPWDELLMAGSGFCGFSFKDGKIATLIWPPYNKTTYSDYFYDEMTGGIYGTYNPDEPAYIIESITEDRIVLRDWLDEVPTGIGKDPATWTDEEAEPEKGSYYRSALRVANEEETEYYLKHYVE